MVQVEPEAQEYILNNGKKAMLILGSMRGCCGGVSPVPKIYLGFPKNPKGYDENKVGDITVFVDKDLRGLGKMRVSYAKFLWLNKLSVVMEPLKGGAYE